jgi:hypothetical protein
MRPCPKHLPAQIQLWAAPALAVRTPALHDLMLDHCHWWWRRQLDHLPAVVQALPAQPVVALRALLQDMPLDARRLHPLARGVVLLGPLLARLALARRFLRAIWASRRLAHHHPLIAAPRALQASLTLLPALAAIRDSPPAAARLPRSSCTYHNSTAPSRATLNSYASPSDRTRVGGPKANGALSLSRGPVC